MFPSAVDVVSDSSGFRLTVESWPFVNSLSIYDGIAGFFAVSS